MLEPSDLATEHRRIHTEPTGFLPVKVDGRRTYFEWISAGHYMSGNRARHDDDGHRRADLRDVYFGFDAKRLLLRVDTAQRAADDLARVDELRVRFLDPADIEIRVTGFNQRNPKAKLCRKNRPVPKSAVEVAMRTRFSN